MQLLVIYQDSGIISGNVPLGNFSTMQITCLVFSPGKVVSHIGVLGLSRKKKLVSLRS